MKLLMIAVNGIDSKSSPGVPKKLLGQYHAFQSLGEDVYFLTYSGSNAVLLHEKEEKILFTNKKSGYINNLSLFNTAPNICREYHIDCCYIRYPLADWSFTRMLRRLHKCGKVVVEIPTYPYDEEGKKNKNVVSQFNFWQDKYFRRKIHLYVDEIVTFHGWDEIFGVPCIKIHNAVDVETIICSYKALNKDVIRLIVVAHIVNAHGIDRLLHGLKTYYEKKDTSQKVLLDVVGDGPEKNNLEDLAKEMNLSEYVVFHGRQIGDKLDEIYADADIGISYLAGHRIGLTKTSALKTCEYAARGLPFITSMPDEAFDKKYPYCCFVPASEDEIDIQHIIDYLHELNINSNYRNRIRQYATENLSWVSQMKVVSEKLNELSEEKND